MPDNPTGWLTNRDFARVFADIAVLLQARGDSVFKTRAYSRAAETINNLQFEVATADQKSLRSIPGFGDAIVTKIGELAATGRLQYFENLKAETPDGILEIIQVPGVGPKTAMRAAEELGINSLEALQASIESGDFEKLPRISNKVAESILRHLKSRISQGDRMPIGEVLPRAEKLIDDLKDSYPGVHRLTYAGSLRRGRETIGDVDLLCFADDPDAAMDAFVSLPGVVDVMSHGRTKSMVVLDSGLQFDLRVVPEDSFAACLLYFTGSKEHGIRLRKRALKHGISLNEYGAKDNSSGELIKFASEREIYDRLELQFISPEIREDSGELEAADNAELPNLISLSDVRGDLHSHTDWTDGKSSLNEMAAAAEAAGLEYLAVTDHSESATVANGLTIDRLLEHDRIVRETDQEVSRIRLLSGSEVDIRIDGSLDYPDEALAGLDVVLGSIHAGMDQDEKRMTARIIRAMESEHLDVFAHPTTRLIGRRAPIVFDFDAVCKAAVETGTLMEINSSAKRMDLKDTHIRRALELGVLFSIGTDSHRSREFADLRYGVSTARRGWCPPERVVNTLPPNSLFRFLSMPKGDRYAFIEGL